MMKISTRGRYAVRAIFDIAHFGQGGLVPLSSIAERQEVSPKYLDQIFMRLRKAGIIRTRRGNKGGIALGKQPAEISVAEVVRATDGPLVLVDCMEREGKNVPCHRAEFCPAKPIWEEASRRLEEYLDSVTIADLCRRAISEEAARAFNKPG